MKTRKYQRSLIVTILLLLAAIATTAPSASAGELRYSECNAGPECDFECVPGLVVYVEITSGTGTITGKCVYGTSPQTTAECSSDGDGCNGQKRHEGAGRDGQCKITGGDSHTSGSCWVGQKRVQVVIQA